MGIFSSNKVYTEREMRWEKFKNSKVMSNLLADKKVAAILDKKNEKKEFYKKLEEKAKGGVTKDEMREFLWDLKKGRVKTISPEEGKHLAWKIMPGEFAKRYKPNNDSRSSLKQPGSAGLSRPVSGSSGKTSRFVSSKPVSKQSFSGPRF